MIIRKPITKPVMRSALTSLSTAASEAASALAVPPSLRSLLFHDDGTATEYPAYYTEEEWADHSHLLKDYSLGVGDLREKRLGYCYDFDGVDDHVLIPHHSSLTPPTISIAAYIYRPASASHKYGVIAAKRSGTQIDYQLTLTRSSDTPPRRLRLNWVDNSSGTIQQAESVSAIEDDAWHHVRATYDGAVVKLYIDGILDNSVNFASTMRTSTASLFVGRDAGTNFSDMRVFDLKIQDAAESVLSAHYPLQEESGATAYDISGNGNHGTITNAVTSGVGSIHQPDAGVVKSYANDEGYRANGSVVIPAASATTAADGNPLTYTGRCPNYGLAKGPAWQGDGSAVYVDLGSPVIPASSDFTITIPYKHVGVSTQAVFSQTETAVTAGRMLVYANQPTANRLRLAYIDLGNTITIDLPVCLTVNEFHLITASRTGNALRITCEGSLGSFTDTESPTTLLVAQFNTHLLSYAGSSRSAGAAGPFAITVGGLTTTYSPIEGTRNVAVTRSDGTYAVIADAMNNGAFVTLYSDGDGSWQLSEIANGARWASQNLLSYSESVVGKNAVRSVIEDVEISTPIGNGAIRVTDNALFGYHGFSFIFDSIADGIAKTVSVFAKSESRTRVGMYANGIAQAIVVWDLGSGQVAFTGSEGPIGSIEYIGDGWYRLSHTIASLNGGYLFGLSDDANNMRYTGDGSSALFTGIQVNNAARSLPYEKTGAYSWSASALVPAAPGASVAANGNALNIPANKHPIGLLVDRTGGVAAPFDYQSGTDGYTNEAFSDVPPETTLNKRGLSIYAADRYGAALEDIQS